MSPVDPISPPPPASPTEGPAPSKGELRAEEYRARAREAQQEAERATLDRVREQRQLAADTWSQLADAEEARARDRRESAAANHDRRLAPQQESNS